MTSKSKESKIWYTPARLHKGFCRFCKIIIFAVCIPPPACLRRWHFTCFNNVSKKNIANVCLGWSFWENKKKDSKQEYIHNIWKEGVTLNNIICIIAILECKRNPVQAVSHHLLLPAKVIETCLQNIWYGYAFESKWK